jgi:hypothetical protein
LERLSQAGIASRVAVFSPDWAPACAASSTPLSIGGGLALLQHQHLAEMTSRRLMQWIEVPATRSGHPNVVFAAISLFVSALTILTLKSLIELWGAL